MALILYIIMFSATLALLSTLSSYIFDNLNKINADSVSSEEFNKFNVNFVKDVKESNIVSISVDAPNVKISFSSGANYTFVQKDKAIYKNKEKIAQDICSFEARKLVDNGKDIIQVKISVGKNSEDPQYTDEIKYVLKYW